MPHVLARADNGEASFSCTWASLTADFAGRDAQPQTLDPPTEWYRTDAQGHYANHGWGPRAVALPPPVIPQDAGCDSATWKRERILAVAMRYVYSPDNPLGLQYRHHHIPAWEPPTSTYAGASSENPDPDAPPGLSAWDAGPGLDCSNFTAWVYNYGLGIKFGGNVHQQWDGSAGPMGLRISREGPFQPGDLIFLHPDATAQQASHVVIYIDDGHIIDSRVNAQNRLGVQVRNRQGWYRDAVLGGWRPIG
ncbi:C40 family peptidase [Mycobacterium kubicae]|uniref:C40 family peptidase n=1 Tax=Mycobacterium kubicae TaxID=120959 RepID=A0AAX1J5N4_9MYCO|nr:NlpC/P60 family protein [Mycobacterium kubicae]QNI07270.1 NlpC/P60 family protein [Mycobacterium kubicae]QPI35805.1 C40 family peptidase [Mycobacterium kubicae]